MFMETVVGEIVEDMMEANLQSNMQKMDYLMMLLTLNGKEGSLLKCTGMLQLIIGVAMRIVFAR